MEHTEHEIQIPYAVQRAIRRYKREFQDAITKLVAKKLVESGGVIKPEEIGECAANIVFGDSKREVVMEQIALTAYHAGKYRLLDDVIDELRNDLQHRPA